MSGRERPVLRREAAVDTLRLQIVPVTRDQAVGFIAAWHRHHAPPLGYRFAIGVVAGDSLDLLAEVGRG